MSKKTISKPLTIALGTALVGGLAAASASAGISAEENPFAMEELTNGQLIAGSHEEGGCGEDKSEGGCGEDKGEGGGDDEKEGEGKCGEGKCGSSA